MDHGRIKYQVEGVSKWIQQKSNKDNPLPYMTKIRVACINKVLNLPNMDLSQD